MKSRVSMAEVIFNFWHTFLMQQTSSEVSDDGGDAIEALFRKMTLLTLY